MKLLIDECVDERLRNWFVSHDCHTARHAGLAGLKNGLLLDAAEAAGFDVLITVDQHIPEQQNLSARRLSILIFCGPTNRLRDLAPLVPAAIAALTTIRPGQVVRISR
jgi:predicted nuclease of predicted toxin-antitoxin system